MRPVFAVSLLLGVVSAAVSGAAAAAPVAVRVRHVLPRTAHGRWPHRRLGNGAVLQQPALSQQLFTVPSGPADGFFVVISGDNDGSSHSAASDDLARLMSFMASELPDATGVHHPGELFAVPQLVQRPVGMLRGGAFPAFSRESGDFHAPVPMDLLRVLDQVADQAMHDLMAHPSAVHVKFHCGADPASDVHEEGAPAQEAPSADGTGSCRADVATHCPNNVASLYETLMCLHSVKSELSIGCQRLLEDDPTVVGHCYDDIATQCAGVSHGHGRIHACLLSHSDALSASCSSYLNLNMASTAIAKPATMPSARFSEGIADSTYVTGSAGAPGPQAMEAAPVHNPPAHHSRTGVLVLGGAAGIAVVVAVLALLIARHRSAARERELEISYRALRL